MAINLYKKILLIIIIFVSSAVKATKTNIFDVYTPRKEYSPELNQFLRNVRDSKNDFEWIEKTQREISREKRTELELRVEERYENRLGSDKEFYEKRSANNGITKLVEHSGKIPPRPENDAYPYMYAKQYYKKRNNFDYDENVEIEPMNQKGVIREDDPNRGKHFDNYFENSIEKSTKLSDYLDDLDLDLKLSKNNKDDDDIPDVEDLTENKKNVFDWFKKTKRLIGGKKQSEISKMIKAQAEEMNTKDCKHDGKCGKINLSKSNKKINRDCEQEDNKCTDQDLCQNKNCQKTDENMKVDQTAAIEKGKSESEADKCATTTEKSECDKVRRGLKENKDKGSYVLITTTKIPREKKSFAADIKNKLLFKNVMYDNNSSRSNNENDEYVDNKNYKRDDKEERDENNDNEEEKREKPLGYNCNQLEESFKVDGQSGMEWEEPIIHIASKTFSGEGNKGKSFKNLENSNKADEKHNNEEKSEKNFMDHISNKFKSKSNQQNDHDINKFLKTLLPTKDIDDHNFSGNLLENKNIKKKIDELMKLISKSKEIKRREKSNLQIFPPISSPNSENNHLNTLKELHEPTSAVEQRNYLQQDPFYSTSTSTQNTLEGIRGTTDYYNYELKVKRNLDDDPDQYFGYQQEGGAHVKKFLRADEFQDNMEMLENSENNHNLDSVSKTLNNRDDDNNKVDNSLFKDEKFYEDHNDERDEDDYSFGKNRRNILSLSDYDYSTGNSLHLRDSRSEDEEYEEADTIIGEKKKYDLVKKSEVKYDNTFNQAISEEEYNLRNSKKSEIHQLRTKRNEDENGIQVKKNLDFIPFQSASTVDHFETSSDKLPNVPDVISTTSLSPNGSFSKSSNILEVLLNSDSKKTPATNSKKIDPLNEIFRSELNLNRHKRLDDNVASLHHSSIRSNKFRHPIQSINLIQIPKSQRSSNFTSTTPSSTLTSDQISDSDIKKVTVLETTLQYLNPRFQQVDELNDLLNRYDDDDDRNSRNIKSKNKMEDDDSLKEYPSLADLLKEYDPNNMPNEKYQIPDGGQNNYFEKEEQLVTQNPSLREEFIKDFDPVEESVDSDGNFKKIESKILEKDQKLTNPKPHSNDKYLKNSYNFISFPKYPQLELKSFDQLFPNKKYEKLPILHKDIQYVHNPNIYITPSPLSDKKSASVVILTNELDDKNHEFKTIESSQKFGGGIHPVEKNFKNRDYLAKVDENVVEIGGRKSGSNKLYDRSSSVVTTEGSTGWMKDFFKKMKNSINLFPMDELASSVETPTRISESKIKTAEKPTSKENSLIPSQKMQKKRNKFDSPIWKNRDWDRIKRNLEDYEENYFSNRNSRKRRNFFNDNLRRKVSEDQGSNDLMEDIPNYTSKREISAENIAAAIKGDILDSSKEDWSKLLNIQENLLTDKNILEQNNILEHNEDFLKELQNLKSIIARQIEDNSCRRLYPELKSFLADLTKNCPSHDLTFQKTPVFKGEKEQNSNNFIFQNEDDDDEEESGGIEDVKDIRREVKMKYRKLRDLLRNYNNLDEDNKNKMESVAKFIRKNMRMLRSIYKKTYLDEDQEDHENHKRQFSLKPNQVTNNPQKDYHETLCEGKNCRQKDEFDDDQAVDDVSTSADDDEFENNDETKRKKRTLNIMKKLNEKLNSVKKGFAESVEKYVSNKKTNRVSIKNVSPTDVIDHSDFTTRTVPAVKKYVKSADITTLSYAYQELLKAAENAKKKREIDDKIGMLFGNAVEEKRTTVYDDADDSFQKSSVFVQ